MKNILITPHYPSIPCPVHPLTHDTKEDGYTPMLLHARVLCCSGAPDAMLLLETTRPRTIGWSVWMKQSTGVTTAPLGARRIWRRVATPSGGPGGGGRGGRGGEGGGASRQEGDGHHDQGALAPGRGEELGPSRPHGPSLGQTNNRTKQGSALPSIPPPMYPDARTRWPP